MKVLRIAPRLLILLVTLGLNVPANAQMYRWTDANGKTVLSDTPPPAGVQAQVTRKGGVRVDPKTGDTAKGQEPASQEPAGKPRDGETPQGSEANKKREADFAAENCRIAKDNLAVLDSDSKIVTRTANGGEAYMTAEEKAAARKKFQSTADRYCK